LNNIMPKKKTTKKKEKKKVSKAKKKAAPKKAKKAPRYFKGIGRRKTANAQVRLFTQGKKEFLVNGKPLEAYFPVLELQEKAKAPLVKMNCKDKFRIVAKASGGGFTGQAGAIQLGLARALVLFNSDFRKRLRKTAFLTRDPRMRERKKPGLKRARRAPQWQKR